ncbi:MAG: hypothetical protein ACYCU5_01730 [Actinomycetes bacterium]
MDTLLAGTPRMQETARCATPQELAERGLTIDEHSLWREPTTVGV